MIVTTVTVSVKLENIQDFISATIENHNNSILESGNLRFDVLQYNDNPSMFTLYEAYDSPESAAAHKETSHYKKWKENVEPWMASPRKGISHKVIKPEERSKW